MESETQADIISSDIELTEQTFRKLMRATRLIRQVMEPFFEGQGISLSQWVVMRNLFEHEEKTGEPLRLIDLSNMMFIRQPTLTVVINKLVLQGLIERAAVPGDRRERRVRLTPKGRQLIEQIFELRLSKIQGLLSPWDTQEKRQAFELLEKLVGQLECYSQSDKNNK